MFARMTTLMRIGEVPKWGFLIGQEDYWPKNFLRMMEAFAKDKLHRELVESETINISEYAVADVQVTTTGDIWVRPKAGKADPYQFAV